MRKALLISVLAGATLFGAQSASAHGDTAGGPIATPALQARDVHHVNPAVPDAPAYADSYTIRPPTSGSPAW